MKKTIAKVLENKLFLLFMNGVLIHTAFSAVIIVTIGMPNEAILDTNLQQVLLIFED